MVDPTDTDPIHKIIADALAGVSGLNVHYQQIPQKAVYPCEVYNIATSDHEFSDDGPDGLAFYRINFQTWANSFEQCKQLHRIIKDIMRTVGGEFEPVGEQDIAPAPRDPDSKQFNLETEFEMWINYPVTG